MGSGPCAAVRALDAGAVYARRARCFPPLRLPSEAPLTQGGSSPCLVNAYMSSSQQGASAARSSFGIPEGGDETCGLCEERLSFKLLAFVSLAFVRLTCTLATLVRQRSRELHRDLLDRRSPSASRCFLLGARARPTLQRASMRPAEVLRGTIEKQIFIQLAALPESRGPCHRSRPVAPTQPAARA
jgi:hypothetical protein